jgi:hypothetical protein
MVLALAACSGSNKGQIGRGKDVDPAPACPSGMNEDSSASAEAECGGQAGLSIKDEGGTISGKCYAKGNTVVKCNLPAECKHGFTVEPDDGNPAGRLKCEGPPSATSSVHNEGVISGDVAGRDIVKVSTPGDPYATAMRTCSSYCGCINNCNDNDNTDGCRNGCNGKRNWCRDAGGCWQDAQHCGC